MASTITSTTKTANSMSLTLNPLLNLRRTSPEYHDSFGDLAFRGGWGNAWNVIDEANRRWCQLKPQLDELLFVRRSEILPPKVYDGPKNPLWALRCYMIGRDQSHASPHVAVVCEHSWFRRAARDLINDSGLLQNVDWRRCIALHADIQQPGKGQAVQTPWTMEKLESETLEVYSAADRLPSSLCGSQVNVIAAGILRVGTIGGVVQIDQEYYGMTVGHIFHSTPSDVELGIQSNITEVMFDVDDLDVWASDGSQDMPVDTQTTSSLSQRTTPMETTTKTDLRSSIKLGILWEYSRKHPEWVRGNLNLDWALVTIDHIQLRKPNRVTVPSDSGPTDILCQSVMRSMPEKPMRVCLVTARGSIIGRSVSSLSTVTMACSETLQNVWTFQVDRIQTGDCGAWVLEVETGDLLGILIATCAALSEAYVLPARDIVEDIRKMTGKEVMLPIGEALPLYQSHQRKYMKALEWEVMKPKTRLANEYPNALTSVNNLALAHLKQGRWNEVEFLLMQMLDVWKMRLGEEEDSNTMTRMGIQTLALAGMNNLALAYSKQGRWKEAEELLVRVVATGQRMLGEESPNVLTTMSNLASVYLNQGRWGEAENLFVNVAETETKVLGERHPDTLTSMANLAWTLKAQGRAKEAVELMSKAAKVSTEISGPQHLHTVIKTEALQDWLHQNGGNGNPTGLTGPAQASTKWKRLSS